MNQIRNKQAIDLAVQHYWKVSLKNWKTIFPGLFLTGIGTILVFYVPPLIIGRLLSKYQNTGIPELSELTPFIAAFGAAWLLGEALWRLAMFLMIKGESAAMQELYVNALQMMIDKDLGFFHDNFAGSLTKKTSGYALKYVDFLDTTMFSIAPNIIPMFFIGFVLWQYSPWLVAVLFGMGGLVLLLIAPLIRQRHKLVALRETASNVVSGHVADVYSNIDAVRAFSNEEFELKKHLEQVGDFTDKVKHSWRYHNERIDTVISPLYVLTNVFGLIVALSLSKHSSTNIEAIFVTFSYYTGFTRVMWDFNGIYRRIESSLSDAAQFTELLIDGPSVTDIDSPDKFEVSSGRIQFKDVDFTYQDDEDRKIFKKLNLDIKPGEKVGLVGHSGGGKTTLTKLLLRFMDIDGGQILIDGVDISKVKQSELRSYLGYVPQDPYMFHRTITENIKYGNLNAGSREVDIAAKLSNSMEFIMQLPKKYDTLIGERGVKLSGGQRQRIAIARAIIRNAPILLLDEATSALDSESENLIQDALWKLMEGRTAIVIAHRLSTIQHMDRIVVMENGKIVEQGSHKELLRKKGAYADLWGHQSGGFIND
jgi:ATP-binding cassette subfamily B protein